MESGIDLARLMGQQAQEYLLALLLHCWDYRHAQLFTWIPEIRTLAGPPA